jgi:hypothetical protein
MKRDHTLTESDPQASKVLSDCPEIPRPSKREKFVADLILIGVALIIVALIWAVEHFKNI